jgi:toxin ParE1/3/4
VKIRWTTPALRDLESIGDHVTRENSPAVAARIVTRVLSRVAGLATYPHVGRPGRVPDTRELVVVQTPFIIPYRVRDDEVQILAVFHGARRWPESFG